MAVELTTLEAKVDWKDTLQSSQAVSQQVVKTGEDMSKMAEKAGEAGKKSADALQRVAQAAQDLKSTGESAWGDITKHFNDVKSASEGGSASMLVFIGKIGLWGAAAVAAYKAVSFALTEYNQTAVDAEGKANRLNQALGETQESFKKG